LHDLGEAAAVVVRIVVHILDIAHRALVGRRISLEVEADDSEQSPARRTHSLRRLELQD
jgi:hypothetical protein